MKLLLTIVLLLSGCEGRLRFESKPAPKPAPESAMLKVDENAQAASDIHATVNELHTQIMKRLAERNADDREAILALKLASVEIAALKRRVAELEVQMKPIGPGSSTTTIHPARGEQGTKEPMFKSLEITSPIGDFDLGSTVRHFDNERPIARFHYNGGSWCNVWADDKGLHWEECK